jgi:hypothetical protein
MSKFFLTSANIFFLFFFDGQTLILEDTKNAARRIPNDIIFQSKIASFVARQYIKSAEFMSKDYVPTIDFTKERFFFFFYNQRYYY